MGPKNPRITKPSRLEKPSGSIESSRAKPTTKPHPVNQNHPSLCSQGRCFPCPDAEDQAQECILILSTTNPKASIPSSSSSSSHSTARTAVAFLCLQPRCSFPSSLCGTSVPPNKGRRSVPQPASSFSPPVWVLMKGSTLETSPDGSGPVSN